MGNLREHNYDFGAVWRTGKAHQLRRSIKNRECYCPLANAAYTNMLTHGPTVIRVAGEVGHSSVVSFLGRRPERSASAAR
jgi:hypothetical protein